jgi:hypothetical protein
MGEVRITGMLQSLYHTVYLWSKFSGTSVEGTLTLEHGDCPDRTGAPATQPKRPDER